MKNRDIDDNDDSNSAMLGRSSASGNSSGLIALAATSPSQGAFQIAGVPNVPAMYGPVSAATGMAQGPSTASFNPTMFPQHPVFGPATYGPQGGHVLSQSEGYSLFCNLLFHSIMYLFKK